MAGYSSPLSEQAASQIMDMILLSHRFDISSGGIRSKKKLIKEYIYIYIFNRRTLNYDSIKLDG